MVQLLAHEMIRQIYSEFPTTQAVDAWDGSLTYGDLEQLSGQLAIHLKRLGVGPEVLVPMCMYKSKWAIIVMLAIMKAGGAFVPLDPYSPHERLKILLMDIDSPFVITSPEAASLIETIDTKSRAIPLEEKPKDPLVKEFETLYVNCGFRIIETASLKVSEDQQRQTLAVLSAAEKPALGPSNIAYVIYTSGSTGTPKGVVIEHGSLASSVRHLGAAFGYRPTSRVLQYSSYTFDAAVLDIFVTLAHGGCICVMSEEQRADPAAAINRMNANLALLTPAVSRTIVPGDVPSLKTLLLGGDTLNPMDISQWAGRVELFNAYGPTECCIVCIYRHITDTSVSAKDIGQVVGAATWIVDPTNHDLLAPIGSLGELVVEGAGLARGYLHDEEKTNKAFVYPKWRNKDSLARAGRVYKTGDLVRCGTNGGIIISGRKDDQVKLHGQRIELGEVEHHLSSNSLVKQCIVCLAEPQPNVSVLVAVLVLETGPVHGIKGNKLELVNLDQTRNHAETRQIRDECLSQMAVHAVPTIWLVVHHIPLLASGKANRRLVKDWVAVLGDKVYSKSVLRTEATKTDRARSDLELKISQRVSQVLGLLPDSVAMNDNFASLGGDSLSAMTLQTQCRDAGIKIKFQDVVKAKSIREIAHNAFPNTNDTFEAYQELDTHSRCPLQKSTTLKRLGSTLVSTRAYI